MVRVLGAGGPGFIGSNLVDRLLERRDVSECLVVDSLWTGCEAGRVFNVFGPRTRVERARAVANFVPQALRALTSPAWPAEPSGILQSKTQLGA